MLKKLKRIRAGVIKKAGLYGSPFFQKKVKIFKKNFPQSCGKPEKWALGRKRRGTMQDDAPFFACHLSQKMWPFVKAE
ncbi:hypothetical protein [Asinibacterium sp. OR53]|uniref:hypothetical protein n=1 Tax=Asinibacterium sp. OR53 TaxID=925409 RepID=UPI00047BF6CA|nr:hypothetical protein [Asinibacterium sp. OR53]